MRKDLEFLAYDGATTPPNFSFTTSLTECFKSLATATSTVAVSL